ncbi:hypothetical protein CTA2_4530 [Colletotrichum tanaceti]|uniref:BTB domain-containing protein n=1 Tax=Colletotrichum tanaceti TaxID=1306861 RepID=A0A4U6X2F7_9PEZI|nr:hypothetical protein CTA2_4530 [Colletotrichum tanaceti]TKW49083.1 hypothetical protein CTA1_2019 [Colletotrichum tanaceti]
MADELFHKIDPDGDVVLILHNPNAPFAVWNGNEEIERLALSALKESGNAGSGSTTTGLSHNESLSLIQQWEGLTPEAQPVEPVDEPVDEPKIKYLVSSRHLSLASNYFQAKFKGPWMEASTKHADGRYHVDASDWDSRALLTLMQAMHGRHRAIPRQVTLEMLAKMAVLVDYYDCLEVIEIFSSMWIESLKNKLLNGLPTQYGRDMVLWLLISHVFQQDDVFSQMTKIAVTQSKEPVLTMELPIPSIVTDLIEWQRQDAIEFIVKTLQDLLGTLRKGLSGCDFECSSILLGALTKNMDEHKLLDPAPKEPYTGHSIVGMESLVNGFRCPQWRCSQWQHSEDYDSGYPRSCDLTTMISTRLKTQPQAAKEGFKLSEIQALTQKRSLKAEATEKIG